MNSEPSIARASSPEPLVRQMTAEERASGPPECAGCGRDAIVWVARESGELVGYCGYLDSGGCLAAVMLEAAK